MNEINETTLNTITDLAATVAREDEEHRAAITTEKAAAGALLERVVEIVKPALRALSSRVQTAASESNNPRKGENVATYRMGRALYLGEKHAGPTQCGGRDDTSGRYGGWDLFLGADGCFFILTYSGGWSHWQNAQCEWEAEERTLTPVEALNHEDLEDILGRILTGLEAQAKGDKTLQTKASLVKAERLRAIVALIG